MDLVQQCLGIGNMLEDVVKNHRIERSVGKGQAAILDEAGIKAAAPAICDRVRVHVCTDSVFPEFEHIPETAADIQGSARDVPVEQRVQEEAPV